VNRNPQNKDTKIMKSTLNLTTAAVALVLFATTSIIMTPANAADRQITVNPKNFPTFTVNNDAGKPADVAITTPDQPQQKITPKAFRVDEKPATVEQASTESGNEQSKIKRTKEDSFRFRIEDKAQQAAETPVLDDEEDATASPSQRPSNLLNEQAKLVKKLRPAPAVDSEPVDSSQDATTEDTDNAADIAADQPETNDEAVANTDDEVATPEISKNKHRTYYYASKQKSYEQSHEDDASTETVYNDEQPTYQQSEVPTYYDYTGASCNHSYNGY
jgi:hypothetical protein